MSFLTPKRCWENLHTTEKAALLRKVIAFILGKAVDPYNVDISALPSYEPSTKLGMAGGQHVCQIFWNPKTRVTHEKACGSFLYIHNLRKRSPKILRSLERKSRQAPRTQIRVTHDLLEPFPWSTHVNLPLSSQAVCSVCSATWSITIGRLHHSSLVHLFPFKVIFIPRKSTQMEREVSVNPVEGLATF